MFAPSAADHVSPDLLNPEQQRAVQARGGHLLVVAGAGTGKTRTLVARVVGLIADGVDPSRILLLTFTRRSAAEMLGRVAAAERDCSGAAAQVWGGTFHSVANRLLRTFGGSAGLPPNFTVLDHADSTELMGMVRTEEGFGERAKRFPKAQTVAAIYSRVVNSQAKLAAVLEVDYPWCADDGDDLKTIFAAYTAAKRRHHLLDYDDLLLFWRGVLASPAGAAMAERFDHVLVDEYQDTNPIQSDILRALTRAGTPYQAGTQVCAVGDDAQAIYGFRSASVENMWAFAEHFPGASIVTLERNYRSTQPILAVANAVLSDTTHFAKKLWTTRSDGPRPMLATHHDEGAQSRAVANAVLDARERGIDLRQQAVLFRAGHHGDSLELELTRRDIPYVKFGGLKYLEAAHVKDLLAQLRILENPADAMAWHRVLASLDGVGPATVRRIIAELGLVEPAPEPSGATAAASLGDDPLGRFIGGVGALPPAATAQAAEVQRLQEAGEALPGSFEAVARELNMPQDEAQALVQRMAPKLQQRFAAQQTELMARASSEWAESAKADKEIGGDALPESMAAAKRALKHLGTPELASLLEDSRLGNHPEVLRFMARAGKALGPDGTFLGGRAATNVNAAQSIYAKSNMNP